MKEKWRRSVVEVFGRGFGWEVEWFKMKEDWRSGGKLGGRFGGEKVVKCNGNVMTMREILEGHDIV
ncbi:hypothetical protein, partial [Siminovitchia fortis]|uniref:hypothetical protein n=1 Tax=Siminovitchia fortis TaxID=254758 RepID=UPI001C92D0DC